MGGSGVYRNNNLKDELKEQLRSEWGHLGEWKYAGSDSTGLEVDWDSEEE